MREEQSRQYQRHGKLTGTLAKRIYKALLDLMGLNQEKTVAPLTQFDLVVLQWWGHRPEPKIGCGL